MSSPINSLHPCFAIMITHKAAYVINDPHTTMIDGFSIRSMVGMILTQIPISLYLYTEGSNKPSFNMNMPSCQYKNSHSWDNTALWIPYIHLKIFLDRQEKSLHWNWLSDLVTTILLLANCCTALKWKFSCYQLISLCHSTGKVYGFHIDISDTTLKIIVSSCEVIRLAVAIVWIIDSIWPQP